VTLELGLWHRLLCIKSIIMCRILSDHDNTILIYDKSLLNAYTLFIAIAFEKIMSRKERIEHQLTTELSPTFLNVEDESRNHHVPEGAQTHFKVVAVSPKFAELNRVARHRLVNHLLRAEFDLGLHALSLHLYTAEEWTIKNKSVLDSPACKDGYKNR
jgi:BolA protein